MEWKENLRKGCYDIIINGKDISILNISYLNLNYIPKIFHFNLIELNCSFNELEELPILPNCLKILLCNNNKIKRIEKLPESIEILNISCNDLESIYLPEKIEKLYIHNNKNINNFEYIKLLILNIKHLNFLQCNEGIDVSSLLFDNLKIIQDDYENIYYNDNDMKEMKSQKIKSFRLC
jgi:hypothetical protein